VSVSNIFAQIYDADYSLFAWPSSPVLAQYIFFHENFFRGKTVLEIGCGTALPGITAFKMGCRRVYLADKFSSDSSRQLVERNLKDNGVSFSWWDHQHSIPQEADQVLLTRITWASFFDNNSPLTALDTDFNPELDCIIASDCFYDEADFENILCTINFLLRFKCKSSACFLMTYQERHSNWNIKCRLQRWNLVGESISLSSFEGDSSHLLGSTLPGNHSIWFFKILIKHSPD
jgi:predicted nicotinamide N-methyase